MSTTVQKSISIQVEYTVSPNKMFSWPIMYVQLFKIKGIPPPPIFTRIWCSYFELNITPSFYRRVSFAGSISNGKWRTNLCSWNVQFPSLTPYQRDALKFGYYKKNCRCEVSRVKNVISYPNQRSEHVSFMSDYWAKDDQLIIC